MSLTRKIAHNTAIQFAGKIAGTILALITMSLILRYLGKTGFGQFATAINYLSVFAILIDLGLYLIVTREIAKDGADESELISNTATFRFVAGVLIMILAAVISVFLPYATITKWAIVVGGTAFLFMSLNQILTGLFQKHLRMEKVTIAEIAGRLFWLGAVAVVMNLDLGLLYIVAANSVAAVIHFVILAIFARRYIKLKPSFNIKLWKKLWKSAAPLALNVVLNLVYFKAGIIALTLMDTEESVGILGAAQKILENLITFSAIFAGLLFPLISKHIKNNKKEFEKIYKKGFDALVILVAPLVVGAFILAEKLIILFGGAEFAEAGNVFRILIFAVGAIFFGNLFGNIVVAADLQKKLVKVYVLNAILAVALSIILIPHISFYGAAVATLITEIIIAVAAYILITKKLKAKPSLSVAGKALLSSFAMAVVIALFPEIHVLLSVSIGAIIYFIVLYATKGISKEMITEIVAFRKK